jgi:hypothetical protein
MISLLRRSATAAADAFAASPRFSDAIAGFRCHFAAAALFRPILTIFTPPHAAILHYADFITL